MKIVHLSTYSTGGAAKAATRLHLNLCDRGINSQIIYLYKNNSDSKNSIDFRDALSPLKKIILKGKNKLLINSQNKQVSKLGKAPEFFTFPISVWDISEHPEIKKADVIHLHWVAHFLNYETLKHSIFKDKKIIWTFHDLNPLSGGFHYTHWFDSSPWDTLDKVNLKFKKSVIATLPVTVIAPSLWLKKISEKSEVFKGKTHVHIKNPSSSQFIYCKKMVARERLGINLDERICFIAGDNTDYQRKGLTLLEKELQTIKTNTTFICTGKRPLNLGQNKQIHVGIQSDENKMALYYAAADVLAFPSLEENFSNTLVESALCGCPSVCFNTGGNIEIIKDAVFGRVIQNFDWTQFLQAILSINFQEIDREKLAETSKIEFSAEKAIDEIIAIYKN